MAKIKEVELIINDEDLDMISAMGFVDMPAIEQDLFYFNSDRNNYVFGKLDEEQGIIVSPALIPEKRIFRYDPISNEEYNVYFSEETISKLSQNFLKSGNHINTTEQHVNPINGVHLIYSWIVANEHDALMTKYGFKNIPAGTWAVSYKIENEDIKEKIKSGEIGGISIEAWLSEKFDKHLHTMIHQVKSWYKDKLEQIKELLKSV